MQVLSRWSHGRASAPVRRSAGSRWARLGAVIGVCTLAVLGLAAPAPAAALTPVVVTGPGVASTVLAVELAGGEVTAELPLINGVTAVLPAAHRLGSPFRVTPDRAVTFASEELASSAPVSTVRSTLGLPATGDEGRGVTVAVVDTGVADVADLRDRVVAHIDVTGSGGGDGHGHGTFMAGLIAASGQASAGAYLGVAPGAKILDVKVARADGGTDLSSVLKGLQVVADQGKRYGVEVLNLSLASGSPVPYQIDPLNQALRALWRTGVTVVVPSGNDGPDPGSVSAPGNDPTLLTVGGVDESGTADHADDLLGTWSGRGPTNQGVSKPDLAAPGAHVIGLRSPGSVIDLAYPSARVGEEYFRGSGTSMASAVTSGTIADLLAQYPRLKPDDVKALLVGTAYRADGLSDSAATGSGGLDLEAALAAAPRHRAVTAKSQSDNVAPGDQAKWKALAKALEQGDIAKAGAAWDAISPEGRSWAGRSWAALDPTTQEWVGRSWAGRSWAGTGATGQEWAARAWAARTWAGDDWAAKMWQGRSWAGDDWTGRSWAGDDWTGRSWATNQWSGRSWAAAWN